MNLRYAQRIYFVDKDNNTRCLMFSITGEQFDFLSIENKQGEIPFIIDKGTLTALDAFAVDKQQVVYEDKGLMPYSNGRNLLDYYDNIHFKDGLINNYLKVFEMLDKSPKEYSTKLKNKLNCFQTSSKIRSAIKNDKTVISEKCEELDVSPSDVIAKLRLIEKIPLTQFESDYHQMIFND